MIYNYSIILVVYLLIFIYRNRWLKELQETWQRACFCICYLHLFLLAWFPHRFLYFYIFVFFILPTSLTKKQELNDHPHELPFAIALSANTDSKALAGILIVGSLMCMIATTLCCLLGQPRILYQMAKDVCSFLYFFKVSNKK